ncbi:MAG: site-specific integrase, partial [Gallionellaceae bacterium]
MTQEFTSYQHYLDSAVRTPHTRRAYLSDLRSFAVWFEQTNAKGIDPQIVTPVDMREWRQRLSAVQELKAATVNRKISAVAHWLSWHRALGHVQENV